MSASHTIRSRAALVALALLAAAAAACSDPVAPGLKAAPTMTNPPVAGAAQAYGGRPQSNGGTIPTAATRPAGG